MKTRTRTLLIAALVGALALPVAAAARRAMPGAGDPSVSLLERAARRLDLTPEQRDRVREIVAAHKGELEGEIAAVAAARGALWDAIHAPEPQPAAIRTAAARCGQTEGDLGVTRAAVVQEVRAVLTPEQQAELQAMTGEARSFAQALLARLRARLDALAG